VLFWLLFPISNTLLVGLAPLYQPDSILPPLMLLLKEVLLEVATMIDLVVVPDGGGNDVMIKQRQRVIVIYILQISKILNTFLVGLLSLVVTIS